MEVANLKDMIGGWFVGSFTPTTHSTHAVEAALKSYIKGSKESKHYNKVATEITLINRGCVRMNGREFRDGDIVVIHPMETCDFEAIEDTDTFVIKVPGAQDDKYLSDLT